MTRKPTLLLTKLLLAGAGFLVAVIPRTARAAADYRVTSYDVDVVIHENNTYDLTETIAVNFAEPRHGINREIPLVQNLARANGTQSRSRSQITHVRANVPYRVSQSGRTFNLRLGDADSTVFGPQTYVISYTYNAGADQLKGADEFYYNLIGTGWDTSIDDVSFTLTFPKEFDPAQLGFSVGSYGTVGTNDAAVMDYQVDGTTISGRLNVALSPGEGFTVRLTLPDGYFVGAGQPFNWLLLGTLVSVLAGVGVAYYWWQEHGRDDPVVETVEFYPPDGLNSAETGYIYDGGLTTDAKISLLIYLAQKGYLRIIDEDKSFTIEQIKPYDGTHEAEQIFFDGLFEKATSVTSADLKNQFYQTLQAVDKSITEGERQKLWWDETARHYQKYTLALATVALGAAFLVPLYQTGSIAEGLDALLIPGFFFFAIVATITRPTTLKWAATLLWVYVAVTMGCWLRDLGNILIWEPVSLVMGVLAVGGGCSLLFFALYMGKLTPEGTRTLGKVRGFRRFLETAEKAKLEALVAQDPEYFYNILPYTYALGVSDVWVRQFRTLATEPPDWYVSDRTFDAYYFNHFLNDTMSSAKSAMTSTPNNSGSGSSGGGGFSGGGGGGGGGSSW